jgi:hypothetical protein
VSDDTDFSKDGLAEAFVRCYKGDYDNEEKTTGGLFEIELNTHTDRGAILTWTDDPDQSFRLRHLNTGRLLTT